MGNAAERAVVPGSEDFVNVVRGAGAFGSHVPELVSRSSKLVNAALDVYSLCGPLAMDKAPKPRVFPKH